MSAAFEAFLARLYVDADARARFLADPRAAAVAGTDLSPDEIEALVRIDRTGLELAAASFAAKRRKSAPGAAPGCPSRPSLPGRLTQWAARLVGHGRT